MYNQNKILLIILTILILPATALAKIQLTDQDPNYTVFGNFNFLGTEKFTGVLSYDDCGKNTPSRPNQPSFVRSGCPMGYNFTLLDFKEIQKIPFSQTNLNAQSYCKNNQCGLYFSLGDTDQYNAEENSYLQKILTSNGSNKTTLTLKEISIGTYHTAHFTLVNPTAVKNLPGSGPGTWQIVLISLTLGLSLLIFSPKKP